MKNIVKCRNWNEYDGFNGAVMFCGAGAYGEKLTHNQAKSLGCTKVKREECLKAMVSSNGYGLLPEILAEVPTKETVHKQELVLVVA